MKINFDAFRKPPKPSEMDFVAAFAAIGEHCPEAVPALQKLLKDRAVFVAGPADSKAWEGIIALSHMDLTHEVLYMECYEGKGKKAVFFSLRSPEALNGPLCVSV